MKWLAILYDDHCGICSRIRRWLEHQPSFVPLRLVPLHSTDLAVRFPGIKSFNPGEKLVVVADDGLVWRGDSAWITLLWALHDGRELALKLSSPTMRPLARKAVTMVSDNRLRFSRWLKLRPDLDVNASACPEGNCAWPGIDSREEVLRPAPPR